MITVFRFARAAACKLQLRPTAALVATAMLFAMLPPPDPLSGTRGWTAFAQPANEANAKPAIRVSRVILAEPEVDTPLAIQVSSAGGVPQQSFLRLRGLPKSAKLSEGHLISPGSWAVPLAALSTLKVRTPIAGSGRSEISIALVTVTGDVLAEGAAALVVAPAWLIGPDGKSKQAASAVAPFPDTRSASGPANRTASAGTIPTPLTTPPSRLGRAPTEPAPKPPKISATVPDQSPKRADQPLTVGTAIAAITPPATVAPTPPPNASAPATGTSSPPSLQTSPRLKAPTSGTAGKPPAPQPSPKPVQSSQTAAPPQISAENRARATAMVERGEQFLKQGNIAAARQFFLRAADLGLAAGAMRMAATYDAAELAKLPIAGLSPQYGEARRWYERARQLGAADAAEKLSRLTPSR